MVTNGIEGLEIYSPVYSHEYNHAFCVYHSVNDHGPILT